jgi:hypothetical protein
LPVSQRLPQQVFRLRRIGAHGSRELTVWRRRETVGHLRRRYLSPCGRESDFSILVEFFTRLSARNRKRGALRGTGWKAPLLHFPSTCSGTSPLANAGKCFLPRKGGDRTPDTALRLAIDTTPEFWMNFQGGRGTGRREAHAKKEGIGLISLWNAQREGQVGQIKGDGVWKAFLCSGKRFSFRIIFLIPYRFCGYHYIISKGS